MITELHDLSVVIIYKFTGHLSIISFLVFLVFVYFLYYFTNVIQKPQLVCRNGKFKDHIKNHVVELQKDYWPLIWCIRPLLMTVIHSLFGHTVQFSFTRYFHNFSCI